MTRVKRILQPFGIQDICARAWRDTRNHFKLSWGVATQSIAVGAVFVALLLYFRGESVALTEAGDIILYIAAFLGANIAPVLLWNLWLAPYRLMGERLDTAIRNSVLVDPASTRSPEKADMIAWVDVEVLELWQAACLWVGLEPHNPLQTQEARAMLAQLLGATRLHKLKCPIDLNLGASGDLDPAWVSDTQRTTQMDLAHYARTTGQSIPAFLKDIELPNDPI